MSATFRLRPARVPSPAYPAALALLAAAGPAAAQDTGDTGDTGEPWEHFLTEDEAWELVRPMLAEHAFEAIFDPFPLVVGGEERLVHPTWEEAERWQLMVAMVESELEPFLQLPEATLCAVERGGDGACDQVRCEDWDPWTDDLCAALGVLPTGGWSGHEDALEEAYRTAVAGLVEAAEGRVFRPPVPTHYAGCSCAEGPINDRLPAYALLCGVLGVGLSCRRRKTLRSRS